MYLYFFDPQPNNVKQKRWCEQIQSRLIGYDIEGTIIQSSIFADSKTELTRAIANNEDITTVIIASTDETFIEAVQWLVPFNKTIGYIPLERSFFGLFFGLPSAKDTEKTCLTLARRRKIEIAAVQVNDMVSFHSITAHLDLEDSLSIDNHLHIKPSAPVCMYIESESKKTFHFELAPESIDEQKKNSLSLLRKKKKENNTILSASYISVSSKRNPTPQIIIDGHTKTNLPAIITPHTHLLRFIVGQEYN